MQPNPKDPPQNPSTGPTPAAATSQNDQEAALRIMRQQISALYDSPQPNEQIAASQPANIRPTETALQTVETVVPEDSPYSQSHSSSEDVKAQMQGITGEQWTKYHSAWQQYYQMYYDRYYQAQVSAKSQGRNPTHAAAKSRSDGTMTRKEAVEEIRTELMQKVRQQTTKVRRSRHFMPILAAAAVAGVFLFLQYNQLLFAQVKAFVSPGVVSSENIIIADSSTTQVGPEPRMVIPSINVDAPFVVDVTSLDEKYIDAKLKEGVVHYPIPGASAMPGEIGNTVVLGHSSNDVFDDGKYKFIFVQLERLQVGDMFYIHYNSTRYTYKITEKKVIKPTEVSELVINNGKPMATLVTCTPVGTALSRLLIIGEQISPDPSSAIEAPAATPATTEEAPNIGGAAQSFFERLFGMSF